MEDKAFCVNCNNFKKIITKERISECKVKNKSFSYIEKYALCADCLEEIYTAEINDINVDNRLSAFYENFNLK